MEQKNGGKTLTDGGALRHWEGNVVRGVRLGAPHHPQPVAVAPPACNPHQEPESEILADIVDNRPSRGWTRTIIHETMADLIAKEVGQLHGARVRFLPQNRRKTRLIFGRLSELGLFIENVTPFHVSRLTQTFSLALRLECRRIRFILVTPEGTEGIRLARPHWAGSGENQGSFPAAFCNPKRV